MGVRRVLLNVSFAIIQPARKRKIVVRFNNDRLTEFTFHLLQHAARIDQVVNNLVTSGGILFRKENATSAVVMVA